MRCTAVIWQFCRCICREEDYKKRLEELKVPKEQLDKIEEEKQEVLAKAEKMQKIENAGQETLARFLQEEKRKYHKSRR